MSLPANQLPAAEGSAELRDLEEHYGSYCRAMRMLVREGKSLKNVQRTVCWQQLARLHDCRPGCGVQALKSKGGDGDSSPDSVTSATDRHHWSER
jgi:hypothetical protein